MRSRYLVLIAALAMALPGCGSDSPITEPAELVRVRANVVLKTDQVLMFAGRSVSLLALVDRVTNASGQPITDFKLEAVLPATWTLRNDTIFAPQNETVARLVVSATYLAPPAAAALPLFAESTTDTTAVTSAVDLKGRRWKVSFGCSAVGYNAYMTDASVYIDSIAVREAVVDSVKYSADSGWVRNYGGVAQLWMTGPMVRWLRNGTIDTVTYRNHHEILRQAPDSLIAGTSYSNERHPIVNSRPGIINQLLRYEGGTFCGIDWRHRRGPVTMQEF